MTTNGTELIEQYKVGETTYSSIDAALSALARERQSTSSCTTIEIIHNQIWET